MKESTCIPANHSGSVRGFTLIELSIVLVIIGLVVGGVLVGREMIRSAELRSVISELENFKAATMAFKGKYAALPGDMSNAEQFWGSDSNCPSTAANQLPKIATCNGDGNGLIGAGTDLNGNSMRYEIYRYWQQLANAGLISGTYTGVSIDALGQAFFEPGLNIPKSKYPTGGWSNRFYGDTTSGGVLFPGWRDNAFVFIGKYRQGDTQYTMPLFTIDAQHIDTKIDDGSPAYGSITAQKNPAGCVTSAVPATARYVVSGSNPACSLYIHSGF